MAAHASSFHLIVNTVALSHDLDAYMVLLRRDGTMTLVGIPESPHPSPSVANLVGLRRSISGSLVGSIAETQQMLDFCAERGVLAEIEKIPMRDIERAFERMLKSDVKYRFVIDMASLKQSGESRLHREINLMVARRMKAIPDGSRKGFSLDGSKFIPPSP
jgi:uncharacterized zinc-type alcohol dehydrogenase-like protein